MKRIYIYAGLFEKRSITIIYYLFEYNLRGKGISIVKFFCNLYNSELKMFVLDWEESTASQLFIIIIIAKHKRKVVSFQNVEKSFYFLWFEKVIFVCELLRNKARNKTKI